MMNDELLSQIRSVFPQIFAAISDEIKHEFMNTAEQDLVIYHFGFGTWIRNFILTEDSDIYKAFVKNGISHKDDISTVIIYKLYKYQWR